jgi:peptidoglycan/LPS O-acetylase OafA/YrhL
MRFTYIDGLRGLAAAAVMLHHFVQHPVFEGSLPWLRELSHYGFVGVPVFFVISGFVIAHSVAGHQITASYYGNFVLRRVVRLDPPYWATIALSIAALALGNRLFPAQARPLPTEGCVISSLFYVYPFFGYEPIVAVFWTLVHEVQFYLAYVALMAAMQRVTGSLTPTRWATLLLIGVPAAVSAARLIRIDHTIAITGYMFALGVFAYYYFRGWVGLTMLLALGAAVAATIPLGNAEFKIAALLTAGSLAFAGEANLCRWLDEWPLQFLGRISYSLYLIHGVIGYRVLSVAEAKFPNVNDWLLLSAAVGSSVLAAWVMRLVIEEPSIALARRLK